MSKFTISKIQAHVSSTVRVQLVDEWLPRADVAAAYAALKDVPNPGPPASFWFALDDILGDAHGCTAALAEYYGETASLLVAHMAKVSRTLPSLVEDGARYLEVWFRTQRVASDKVYFHFDHDDRAEDRAGQMRFPMWSSIMHLGPEEGVAGGETAICLDWPLPPALLDCVFQKDSPEKFRAVTAAEWLDIPRRPNRFVFFRGYMAHYVGCVRKVEASSPRLTLLVNAWDHLPLPAGKLRGCSIFTPEEFRIATKLRMQHHIALEELLEEVTPGELSRLASVLAR